MHDAYTPPLALTIIGAVSLLLGVVFAAVVAVDIVLRKGWRSMMGIMIPVYIITPLYLGPLGVWFYMKYGRPRRPDPSTPSAGATKGQTESKNSSTATPDSGTPPAVPSDVEIAGHCCHDAKPTPYWVTVFSGVTHCGAGCVLGDIVGEWLVYGTGVSIRGQSIWPELLIDYAFALLFGIVFQYFSIAPMSGQWGWKTVWRAVKADVGSLTSFEVGLFGWMVAYQAGIWGYRLSMVSTVYWWMMQVGMALGFATAYPVNWLLIKYKIKEPCV